MSAQPEALRLADALEHGTHLLAVERDATAAELRRLHAELVESDAAQGEAVAWPKADDSAKELGWSWDYKWLESLADATRAAGWDTSMEAIDFVLSRVAAPQAPPVEWFVQWIRNNYQNHPNIASLCDAMREAAHGITKEQDMTDKQPDALALADALETFHNPHDKQAAAELRRLHDENEALKAAQYECGFGAGCCYQAAKSEADEVLLRQALDALSYWLEHGETPGAHDMIQRTHDVLQERLK